MAQEAASSGEVLRAQLAANREQVEALVRRLRQAPPRLVITCARGSSDHAATFAKYLIEQELGLPVVSFTPSLASLHDKGLGGPDALFVAISQSGGSPDIVSAARHARSCGSLVVAMVNVEDSPLAAAAECVIPLRAGPEISVAATKSFIASLGALLHLVLTWKGGDRLLGDLSDALTGNWQRDWDRPAAELAKASSLFVIGRGLGLGVAQELALKFKETCGIHAEAFSGAEVRHGPMALIVEGFPVIMLAQRDESLPGMQALGEEFVARGACVYASGLDLPRGMALPECGTASMIAPLQAIQGCYKLVNAVALARGHDPDMPPYLAKVTCTL